MNWFDYILLLVLGFSVLFASLRGFLREVISLASWVVAYGVASRFSPLVEPYLATKVHQPVMLAVLAFCVLFVAVLLVMAILGRLLQLVAGVAGLNWLDRTLGMAFGLGRGILVISVGFMVLLSLTASVPGMVKHSLLAPYFVDFSRQLSAMLPDDSVLLSQVRKNYRDFRASLPKAGLDPAELVRQYRESQTGKIGQVLFGPADHQPSPVPVVEPVKPVEERVEPIPVPAPPPAARVVTPPATNAKAAPPRTGEGKVQPGRPPSKATVTDSVQLDQLMEKLQIPPQ